ncbi:hypothetical protein [Paucibacter sp. Y2R2-4]|uniref:hypothetical protein n=1 Tax=Paucibacter sp. Y2R2-4 TaxID=2893553 RepID=UPI0021E4EDCF|nr:hypothetical protein [Paucibacter sp. Y2R2-4]MCV2349304.1 hypothetical protein [Paucibacter sp. Y2R2-4]
MHTENKQPAKETHGSDNGCSKAGPFSRLGQFSRCFCSGLPPGFPAYGKPARDAEALQLRHERSQETLADLEAGLNQAHQSLQAVLDVLSAAAPGGVVSVAAVRHLLAQPADQVEQSLAAARAAQMP